MRCDSSNMLINAALSMGKRNPYREVVAELGRHIREVQDGELCREALCKFYMIGPKPYEVKMLRKPLGLSPEAQDDLVRRLG